MNNSLERPFISVIIPVYNVQEYIIKCLDSIVNQDISCTIEVIIVDDCGQDQSIALAKEFVTKNSSSKINFKLIRHPHNKGQGAARNEGVKAAKGKYLFFIDSDDSLFPDSLRTLVQFAATSNYDIIEGQTAYSNQEGQIFKKTQCRGCHNVNPDELWQIGNIWKPVCWNKIIKRDYFIKHNLWFIEGIFYEDLHWATLVALSDPQIMVIPNVTYNYLIRSNSTTHTITEKHIGSFKKLLNSLKDIYLKNNKIWKDETIVNFVAQFERLRSMSIDLIIPYCNESIKRSYIDEIRLIKLVGYSEILTNKNLDIKHKLKITPLFCGILATSLIKAKSFVSKLLSK